MPQNKEPKNNPNDKESKNNGNGNKPNDKEPKNNPNDKEPKNNGNGNNPNDINNNILPIVKIETTNRNKKGKIQNKNMLIATEEGQLPYMCIIS
jgi:hypothetical protein